MVICKYYQQGICRFGSNCRFEHPRSDYEETAFRGRYGGNQYGTNNYYNESGRNTVSYKAGNNPNDFEEVMRMIFQEVIQIEKGGQWPLSCFAPIRERQCFPGWEDYSPEEIRWKMYEANQNGTFVECQRQVKELYDAAKLHRHQILNPSNETFTIIEKLLRGQKIETETSFSFVQAASRARESSTGTGNNFLSWNSPGFGSNQQQTPASSNFVFALPQLAPSGQAAVQQPSNGFYNNSVQTMNSVSSQNVFNSSNQLQSPFTSVSQDSPGFLPTTQASVSSNAFGGNKSDFNSASVWNKVENNATDISLYTPKVELSQEELNAFVAQTFTMGKVPTKPPPKELCTV